MAASLPIQVRRDGEPPRTDLAWREPWMTQEEHLIDVYDEAGEHVRTICYPNRVRQFMRTFEAENPDLRCEVKSTAAMASVQRFAVYLPHREQFVEWGVTERRADAYIETHYSTQEGLEAQTRAVKVPVNVTASAAETEAAVLADQQDQRLEELMVGLREYVETEGGEA